MYENNRTDFSYQPPQRQNNKGVKVFIIVAVAAVLLILLALVGAGVAYTVIGDFQFAQPSNQQQGEAAIEQAPTPDFDPEAETLSVREIAAKVKPSVVGIVTTFSTGNSGGSGIIAREDGYIVTNAHVIDGALAIQVVLDDEEKTTYDATVVGSDSQSDIAVIKVDANGLAAAEFGDSDKLAEGDLAVAIGNPRGLELQGTVTVGYISAINRNLRVSEGVTMTLIQTDAAINPGNSGGALVNEYGQVIGINSRKFNTIYYEGLGFAIPSNYAVSIVNDLIGQGFVSGRPRIGITGYTAQTSNGVQAGVYVESVAEDANAGAAGIMPGDLIIAADGTIISSMSELNNVKNQKSAGDTIRLTVVRSGRQYSFDVQLVEMVAE